MQTLLEAYRVETTLTKDGLLIPDDLLFRAGKPLKWLS